MPILVVNNDRTTYIYTYIHRNLFTLACILLFLRVSVLIIARHGVINKSLSDKQLIISDHHSAFDIYLWYT